LPDPPLRDATARICINLYPNFRHKSQ